MNTVEQHHGRCGRAGCTASAQLTCAYVDRRGRECATEWCPSHAVPVWEWAYCSRHGGVLHAVGEGLLLSAPLPDANDRAASLALWVSSRIEAGIRDLLTPHQSADAQLVLSPVQLAYFGPERLRFWRKRWLLASSTGADHAISVGVVESDPRRVTLDIDGERIGAAIPPWLDDRAVSAEESPDAQVYYRRLLQRVDARLRLVPVGSGRPGEVQHYTSSGGAG